MDLAFEKQTPSADEVRDMETRKTGELISAALVCGALLGGASDAEAKTFRKLGLTAGLAFQIADDLLNIHGDAKVLGKATGSDAARGKASLPRLLGEEAARLEARELMKRLLKITAPFGPKASHLDDLLRSLIDREF